MLPFYAYTNNNKSSLEKHSEKISPIAFSLSILLFRLDEKRMGNMEMSTKGCSRDAIETSSEYIPTQGLRQLNKVGWPKKVQRAPFQ